MDKQLLEALDNLSYALELLSESLDKKKESNSPVVNTLQSGDFGNQLIEISSSLKELKNDTKKILENQNTILELSKKDSKPNAIEESGDSKNVDKLKNGASTIILIAGAVLAIGLAFKIVGDVDFLSVIALSTAIVLLGFAFEKVWDTIERTKFDPKKDGLSLILTLTAIATSMTISSYILSGIQPVSLTQMLTAILISGAFAVVAYGMTKMLDAFDGKNPKDIAIAVISLPLILPAIGLGIALASWSMQLIVPVSFYQAVTAILLAGVFAVVSFGMAKMLDAFKGKNPKDIATAVISLPIILPAIGLGIALASWSMQLITPISFNQAITAILIAGTFAVVSFGMAKMLDAFKGKSSKDIAIAAISLPSIMVGIAMGIAGSSFFLSKVETISPEQFLTSLGISIVFVAISFGINKLVEASSKTNVKDLMKTGLFMAGVSAILLASAYILSEIPEIDGTKLINFGLLSVGLITASLLMIPLMYAMKSLGVKEIIAGALAIPVIAGGIAAASYLLEKGSYTNTPDYEWSKKTGLALLVFGTSVAALGFIAIQGGGLGAVALVAGALAVAGLSFTIAESSKLLKKGDYTGGPSVAWSKGVGLSLLAFGTSVAALGAIAITGIGTLALVAGGVAVLGLAEVIKRASFILKGGSYTGGPDEKWAKGIGLAISAFSPVYNALLNAGMFSAEVNTEDFVKVIQSISTSIMFAGDTFAGSDTKWSNYPSEDWSKGVGLAIGSFASVFSMLTGRSWYESGTDAIDNITTSIQNIAKLIVSTSNRFSQVKVWYTPPKDWSTNIANSFRSYIDMISDVKWDSTVGVDSLINSMVSVASKLYRNSKVFAKSIDPNYFLNLSSNIKAYTNMIDVLKSKEKDGDFAKGVFGMDIISQAADGMIKIADAYDKLATSISRFSGSLQGIDADKVNAVSSMTNNMALLSAMNESSFNNMMDTFEKKAGVMGRLVDRENKVTEVKTPGVKKNAVVETKSKNGTISEQLDTVITLLSSINKSTLSVDEYISYASDGKVKDAPSIN